MKEGYVPWVRIGASNIICDESRLCPQERSVSGKIRLNSGIDKGIATLIYSSCQGRVAGTDGRTTPWTDHRPIHRIDL